MLKSEFRVYNKFHSSCFDLIGHKEPDQTKGLGYLLSKSPNAIKALLFLIFTDDKSLVESLITDNYIVDCESLSPQRDRADIVIRFYKDLQAHKAIVIEAKSINNVTESDTAAEQLKKYTTIVDLEQFKNNIQLVSLTKQITLDSNFKNVRAIAWKDLISVLQDTVDDKKNNDELISEYLNYILNIQSSMYFYEEEVLSLPAGRAINAVKDLDCSLYECPTEGRQFKTRGSKKFLYFAFRASKAKGRIDKLYKVDDIISLRIDNTEDINAISSMKNPDGSPKYPLFKERIDCYIKKYSPKASGQKWVFLINNDDSIELPYPVQYDRCRGMTGGIYHKLKDLIRIPLPGENTITIQNKNR